jgi:cytoskeletal protein CcmA (bactofilin family)
MKSRITRILLLLALFILPTGIAQAQDPTQDGDVVRFGQNYTLDEGETLNGSIAVFGGNVTIEKDATVNGSGAIFGGNFSIAEGTVINGDLAVFGGSLTVSGEVNGDIVIFGGQALLTAEADISGDIATFGGQVTQEPGANVNGDITQNAPPSVDAPDIPNVPNVPNVPDVPNSPEVNVNVNPFWNAAGKFAQAVIVAGIGMLLALFLQPQLDRTAGVILRQPLLAGGYGLLIIVVTPIALVLLSLTIILLLVTIPLGFVFAILVPLAWLFGVIALGQEVGERFAKAVNQVWAPVLSTGFGAFLLMLVIGFMDFVPCVGWIPSALVALVGIGATAMTWFGTRNPPGYFPSPSVDEIPPAS